MAFEVNFISEMVDVHFIMILLFSKSPTAGGDDDGGGENVGFACKAAYSTRRS
jgi:hypothetical protein